MEVVLLQTFLLRLVVLEYLLMIGAGWCRNGRGTLNTECHDWVAAVCNASIGQIFLVEEVSRSDMCEF